MQVTDGDPRSGLITVPSAFAVREATDRLEQRIREAGLQVFARIDHAANASGVGLALRPMELLLFGHPRGGTPLMQDNPLCGIDLPVRALVWEDGEGAAWLTYNDARWLARRHDLSSAAAATIETIRVGLARIAAAVERTAD